LWGALQKRYKLHEKSITNYSFMGTKENEFGGISKNRNAHQMN
jgi:hypothetical protein